MSRGPSRPAAHIKPGESSKATAERKRPAAAKRRSGFQCRRVVLRVIAMVSMSARCSKGNGYGFNVGALF
jgi:hypothetical protein